MWRMCNNLQFNNLYLKNLLSLYDEQVGVAQAILIVIRF